MSIPQRSPHRLSSLQPQWFSGFEEPVGTKWDENKKCPPNWNKLVERAAGGTKMERWEMSREIIWENKLRAQSEHSGRGYIGKLLDLSMFVPAPYPLYLFKKEKAEQAIR